jgi:hypothetical protein
LGGGAGYKNRASPLSAPAEMRLVGESRCLPGKVPPDKQTHSRPLQIDDSRLALDYARQMDLRAQKFRIRFGQSDATTRLPAHLPELWIAARRIKRQPLTHPPMKLQRGFSAEFLRCNPGYAARSAPNDFSGLDYYWAGWTVSKSRPMYYLATKGLRHTSWFAIGWGAAPDGWYPWMCTRDKATEGSPAIWGARSLG